MTTTTEKEKPKIKKIKSARGVKGFILPSFKGGYFFRVYKNKKNGEIDFKDYNLAHSDLEVRIRKSSDASFYELENGSLYLDHDPATLGLNKDGSRKTEEELKLITKNVKSKIEKTENKIKSKKKIKT